MSRVLFGLCAVLTLTVADPGGRHVGKRVRVTRPDKPDLYGIVLEEEDDRIVLKQRYSKVWLKRKEVKIDVLKPPLADFDASWKKCVTAEDFFKLGIWAESDEVGLPDQAKECYRRAVEKDAGHARALRKLGKVRDAQGNVVDADVGGVVEVDKERQGRPWPIAEVVETDYFRVKCNSTREVAGDYRRLADDLFELLDGKISRDRYPRHWEEKSDIFIVRNHGEFMDFTGNPPFTGGFFNRIDKGIRTYHGGFGVAGSTNEVLAHEMVHLFQDRIFKHSALVPKWLIEGMAVYYGEGIEVTRNGVRFSKEPPRDRLRNLKAILDDVDTRSLLRVTDPRGEHYAAAWGIIFWCLRGQKHGAHGGEGVEVWHDYLQHLATELPDPTKRALPFDYGAHLENEAVRFEKILLERTGFASLAAWEKKYREFIRDLPLEALGKWSGSYWKTHDGGIRLSLPDDPPIKLRRLRKAEQLNLDLGEEMAAVSSETPSDLRLWLSIDANLFFGAVDDEQALRLLDGYIHGRFRGVRLDAPPKVGDFKGTSLIRVVRASFEGKIAESAAARKLIKDGGYLDLEKKHTVRVALIIAPDRLYALFLAGDEEVCEEMGPVLDKVLVSVKLKS